MRKITIGEIDPQKFIQSYNDCIKEHNRRFNKLTIDAHEKDWQKNLKYNAKQKIFQKAKSITQLVEEVGEVKEVCLIGAGATVSTRIDDIRKLKARGCLLLATDAITKWMFDNDIIPDYVFMLDSKKIGTRFFSGLEDKLNQTSIVVSSAVDKELVPYLKCFKQVYGYHMYDPSMPNWGGEAEMPQVINDVAVLDSNKNYSAHIYLPNLDYILNKGNVGNLVLLVGTKFRPKVFYGIGNGYCIQLDDNGNPLTRATIRDDDVGHEIGGKAYEYKNILTVQRPYDGKLFMTKGDFFGYAKIALDMINEFKIPYRDLSDGLLRRTKDETKLV